MQFIRNTIFILLTFILYMGCGDGGNRPLPPDDPNPIITKSTLTTYNSCNEFLADLKSQALNRLEEIYDSYSYCYSYEEYEDDAVSVSSDDASSPDSGSTAEYTSTNLQETGVDEPDIIKTDGEYIYVVTQSGIDIFKGWPLDNFSKITSYNYHVGSQTALFLMDDQLILLTNDDESSTLKFSVLNVTDPSNPTLIAERELDGSYNQARLVDGVVHIVLSASFMSYDIDYPYDAYDYDCGSPEYTSYLDSWKSSHEERINASTIEDWIPSANQSITTLDCTNVYKDSSSSNEAFAGLWSLKLSANGLENEKLSIVSGQSRYVYASTESVYMASTAIDNSDATDIHRFKISRDDDLHQYIGGGQVTGHIDNSSMVGDVQSSFLMGEKDGVLRIATTVGHVSGSGSSDVYNNVYTIDTSTSTFTLLGKIEDIARGEQIYAARFIGDRGYLVTFEKIDPLFIVDLSDPANPQLTGELEMPGFSSYIHALDDNHLIGLGKDAEDMGSFAWFQGLKLAVFDVEDATSPSIVDDLVIGSRGSDSPALTDHHAFTFDTGSNLLALPLSLYEGGDGESDYGDFEYYGVHIYSLSADSEIKTEGIVDVSDQDETMRTLFIGDEDITGLYILDNNTLHLVNMESPNEIQNSVTLSDSVTGSYGYEYLF